jgi:subtilisin family serine protease
VERAHLKPWWYTAMQLDRIHASTTGKGATVALIDTALNSKLPEFHGADIRFAHTCDPAYQEKAKPATGHVADHGTAMASLIVGQGRGAGPGDRGVMGVAPNAHLLFCPNDRDQVYNGDESVDCDEYMVGAELDSLRRDWDDTDRFPPAGT